MKKKIQALTNKKAKELEKLCHKLDEIYYKTENKDVLYCGIVASIANQCMVLPKKGTKSFVKEFTKDLKKTIKSMKKLAKTGSP